MATPTTEISADMKKLVTDVYLTPAYVAVGLTDLAVQKMREANLFDPIQLRKELSVQAEKVVKQAPARLLERGRRLAKEAQADYDVLAEHGQQATQDLLTQLDNTVSITRGAMSTARNAVVQSERAAVATLKTGIDEAENVAVKLAETAREDVEVTRTSVREATARTRAAAARTSGVANSGARNTSSRAKATATSARKSASKAADAASAAAEQIG